MTDKHRTPLILISGLSPDANQELVDQLREPGTAVVHHDLRQVSSGVVLRTVHRGGSTSLTTLEPAHACVSCTLREDLLPLLRRLAAAHDVERIVVRLDEAMEPAQIAWAIHHVVVGDRPVIEDVEVEAVATVFDTGRWFHDAIGDETLAERGLRASADDERALAQVALAQLEFADVLVSTGAPSDAWTAAKTSAVLRRAAPTTPILELAATNWRALRDAVSPDARRGTVEDPHGYLLRGQPPLDTDCGVTVVPFSARRPFHPGRLHEAIDVLLDGVVRTRGRVWIASQPDVALWIESAGGGLGVGHLGPWLDTPDAPRWEEVSSERRTLASLHWDPFYGDRHQEIVVITHDTEPRVIETALRGALPTDDELAEGRESWVRYPDPFAKWHEDPCEDIDPAGTSTHQGRTEE